MLEHPRSSITIMECWGCTTSIWHVHVPAALCMGCSHHPHGPRVWARLGACGWLWGAQRQGDRSVTAPCAHSPAHLAADIEPDSQIRPVGQVNHGHQVLVVGGVCGQGERARWWDRSFWPQKPPKVPTAPRAAEPCRKRPVKTPWHALGMGGQGQPGFGRAHSTCPEDLL